MSGMIDAFKIGVEMALFDKVTPELAKLTKRLGTVNKDMDKVLKSTSLVNKEFTKWMEMAKQLNASLRAMSDRFAKMGAVADEAGLGLKKTAADANAVAASMERAATAAKAYGTQASLASRAARYSLVPGGAGGGKGGGVPPVVPVPGGGKGKGHGRWGHVHVGPHGLGVGAAAVSLGDAMPWVLGGAIVGAGVMHAYKAYGHYQSQQVQFRANGLSAGDVGEISKFVEANRVPGMDKTEAMELFGSMYSIMADKHHAEALFPTVARMKVADQALYGDKFTNKHFEDMLRVAELRGGAANLPRMFSQLNMMQHAITGYKGNLNPSEYLKAMQTGGNFFRMWDDESFYYAGAPMMKEFGGSRFGTGSYSLFQNWALGRMTDKVASELVDHGLGRWEKKWNSKKKRWEQGFELNDKDEFVHHFPSYIKNFYLPLLAKQGIKTPEQNIFAASNNVGIRTAGAILAMAATQTGLIDKDVAMHKGAMGINQSASLVQKTNDQQIKNFNAALHDFNIELGRTTSPAMSALLEQSAKRLREFTGALQGLSDWMAHNSFTLAQFNKNASLSTMGGDGPLRAGFLNRAWDAAKRWMPHFGGSSSPKVPPGFHVDHHKTGDVYLDGHKVGRVLDAHAARRANGPMIGGVGLDPSLSYLPTSIAGGT